MTKSACALLGLALMGMGWVNLEPSLAQSSTVAPPAASIPSPVYRQLLGQWQTTDAKSKQTITLVFAPQEQCFMVLPTKDGQAIAIKMRCQLSGKDTSDELEGELDFVMSASETALSRYVLTPEGKLRVDLDVKPGEERPATLNPKAPVFERVSQTTTIADNIQVIELDGSKAPDHSAIPKRYLTVFNQAQQAYFASHGKFATRLEELGVVGQMETQYYRYELLPSQDASQGALMAAQPKEQGLPSFVGAVFSTDRQTTITGICESATPSDRLKPQPPTSGNLQIQCPDGSRLVQ